MACLIKIAICDDDIELTSQLETIIKNFARNQNIHIETDIFFNGKSFMEYIEKQHMLYDLVFLDIEMEGTGGMETAHWIRERDKTVIIIFVTHYTEYAIEAYEVHPFQFVVKPLNEEKICNYFKQAYEIITADGFYYEYKYKKDNYRVLINDIMYFESRMMIIYIYLKDGTKRQYYDKLDLIQKSLENTKADFWRIHKSILVNSRYIIIKSFNYIELPGGKKLSISEARRKEINEIYIQKIVKHMEK